MLHHVLDTHAYIYIYTEIATPFPTALRQGTSLKNPRPRSLMPQAGVIPFWGWKTDLPRAMPCQAMPCVSTISSRVKLNSLHFRWARRLRNQNPSDGSWLWNHGLKAACMENGKDIGRFHHPRMKISCLIQKPMGTNIAAMQIAKEKHQNPRNSELGPQAVRASAAPATRQAPGPDEGAASLLWYRWFVASKLTI